MKNKNTEKKKEGKKTPTTQLQPYPDDNAHTNFIPYSPKTHKNE